MAFLLLLDDSILIIETTVHYDSAGFWLYLREVVNVFGSYLKLVL